MISNAQTLNAAVQKFHLCLKARSYDEATPYLELDLLELFKAGSGNTGAGKKTNDAASSSSAAQPVSSTSGGPLQSLFGKSGSSSTSGQASGSSRKNPPHGSQSGEPAFEVRQVLLYFYYGSMVLCARQHYEETLLFLEHALCLPAVRPSAIVLECMKKYVLVSLILGRGRIELPTYKSSVISRTIIPMASLYMKLAQIYQVAVENKNDVASVVHNYLEQNRAAFAKDQHIGLMKRVVIACKENAVKRLGNVFTSLSLKNVSALANIGSDAETLEIVRRLCARGELNVRIDDATRILHFSDVPVAANDVAESLEELDALLSDVAGLKKQIGEFNEAVQLCPAYLQRTAKMARAGDGGTLFPEDEGFHAALAGNSGTSSSPPPTSS